MRDYYFELECGDEGQMGIAFTTKTRVVDGVRVKAVVVTRVVEGSEGKLKVKG